MTNRNPQSNQRDIWTHRSQSWGTGAQNSAAVDCLFYGQAAFSVRVGVIGASGTVDAVVQESDTGSSGWTDVPGNGPSSKAAITQITATDGTDRIAVSTRGRKRYLRLAMTIGVAASQAASVCFLSEPSDSNAPQAITWKRATPF